MESPRGTEPELIGKKKRTAAFVKDSRKSLGGIFFLFREQVKNFGAILLAD